MSLTITKDIPIAAKPKIGRNDPCFCGSGKKYKKCCIDKDATYVPRKGEVAKMVDWLSAQAFFQNIIEKLSIEIFGEKYILDENDIQAVTETAIYEGLFEGKTPFELFLEKAPLSKEEFQKYTDWKQKTIFSIFEVLAIDYGKSLSVCDLYTNRKYIVFERLGTYGAETGMILATRILPQETDWVFSGGMLLPIPKEIGYNIKRTGNEMHGSLSQIEVLKMIFSEHEEKLRIVEENFKKVDPKLKPGPLEQMLLREMMFEAQRLNINKQKSQNIANSLFNKYAQNWLNTPQSQLENKTPEQVILDERNKLGNPHKKLTYKFNATKTPGGINNTYMKAVDFMQKKYLYLKALKSFAMIEDPLENLEEPFRYLCNVGACLVYLGQMEIGKKYFEKSLKLNPNYELAKRNLQNHQNSKLVKQMRARGLQKLFFESIDDNFFIEDKSIEHLPFIQDAVNFIEYVNKYSPHFTHVRCEITFKNVLNLNSLFANPDPTSLEITNGKKKMSMDYNKQVQFPKVNFLHNTCLAGRLIKEEKYRLKITRKGLNFLKLTPSQQFELIFSAFFSKLTWPALNGADNPVGSVFVKYTEILQNINYSLLKTMQNFQAESFTGAKLLEANLPKTSKDNSVTLMLSVMTEALFLNYLVWMGILESYHDDELKLQPITIPTYTYSLTSFGNKIIEQIDKTMQNSIPELFYQLIEL